MKKNVVAVLSAFACLFALAACATVPTPSNAVSQTLDAIKAQDLQKLEKVYAGDTSSMDMSGFTMNISGMDVNSITEGNEDLTKNLINALTSFEYTLGKEEITDNTASVEVSVKTYDVGTVFKNSMTNYLTDYFKVLLTGTTPSQEETTQMFLEKFSEEMSAQTEKTYTGTTTISLTKDGNEWKVDELSQETVDILTGGSLTSLEDFAESLDSIASEALS